MTSIIKHKQTLRAEKEGIIIYDWKYDLIKDSPYELHRTIRISFRTFTERKQYRVRDKFNKIINNELELGHMHYGMLEIEAYLTGLLTGMGVREEMLFDECLRAIFYSRNIVDGEKTYNEIVEEKRAKMQKMAEDIWNDQ